MGGRWLLTDNVQSRLIDDDGNDITADDVRGEICVRGPTVVKGYLNNDKANRETWDDDGYLKSGDILYRDGKTKLWYIVDRKKVSEYFFFHQRCSTVSSLAREADMTA